MDIGSVETWTTIAANAIAIIAAIWAFFQFIGWVKRKQGNSESEVDLALRAAQQAEKLEKLRQEIARTEQAAAQQRRQELEKERDLKAEIAQYESEIHELQNKRALFEGQNELEKLRSLNEPLLAQREGLKRQQEVLKQQQAEKQCQQAEEKRLQDELQAKLQAEQIQYAMFRRGELSPLNPLDWAHLLWWVLWMPQYIKAYENAHDENSLKKTGAWLASTLTWLPLLIGTSALSIYGGIYSDRFVGVSGIVAIFWLLTGIFGYNDDESDKGLIVKVLVFLAVGVAVFFIMSGLVRNVRGDDDLFVMLILGIAFTVASFVTSYVIETETISMAEIVAGAAAMVGTAFIGLFFVPSLFDGAITKNDQPSIFDRILFLLLMADYIFLLWYFYLGGW